MSDTKIEETEKVVSIEEVKQDETVGKNATVEKPYKFKELGFDDIFPMMALINKIGIEKILSLMENKAIFNLIQGQKPMKIDEEGNEVEDKDEYLKQVGMAMVAIVQLIIGCLGNCRNELYTVLASASNLTVEEISKLPLKYVSSMIVDFVKKDDFKDFFKGLLGSIEM